MQWLLTTYVRRYQRHYHSNGHIWQGRFKAFPVQEDDHLRVVLRYIERNALRAAVVERAEDWPWSSLHGASAGVTALIRLDAGPAPRGDGWVEAVNSPTGSSGRVDLGGCPPRSPTDPGLHITRTRFLIS